MTQKDQLRIAEKIGSRPISARGEPKQVKGENADGSPRLALAASKKFYLLAPR